MPKLERLQKNHHKRTVEEAASTFPEEYTAAPGGDPDVDELLKRIDHILNEQTTRSLGRSAGIDVR